MRADLCDMPARIRALPRDRRGYPIPVTVMRDKMHLPHFTMNDALIVARCARDRLCGICGERLGVFACFVGGPGSAFHPAGRYFDGPMHRDCGAFALRTCPYLALAGTYARQIGGRTLRPDAVPDGRVLIAEDPTVHAPQPAVFVLGSCRRFHVEGRHFVPDRPWIEVQFYRGGQEIGNGEARALAEADPTAAAPFSELIWPGES
jgi:hypothetical protein